jgi:GNAT superfamily N-acetyltransferase
MTAVHGPLGFTDLDHEGMLVEGFDRLGTLATLYNYPYYPTHVEKLGYQKDADWIEFSIKIPTTLPANLDRIAEIVLRRQQLRVLKVKSAKEILPYASQIFELINIAYGDLYGVVPLTPRQVDYYVKQYFTFIHPDFVSLILDREGKLAAFGITMPSLSRALQKAAGSLFPLGIFYLLGALRWNKHSDLYLVAVRPELQGKGVNAILMREVNLGYIRRGIQVAESNPQLENNVRAQMWEYYEYEQHKRRRCYIKQLRP